MTHTQNIIYNRSNTFANKSHSPWLYKPVARANLSLSRGIFKEETNLRWKSNDLRSRTPDERGVGRKGLGSWLVDFLQRRGKRKNAVRLSSVARFCSRNGSHCEPGTRLERVWDWERTVDRVESNVLWSPERVLPQTRRGSQFERSFLSFSDSLDRQGSRARGSRFPNSR